MTEPKEPSETLRRRAARMAAGDHFTVDTDLPDGWRDTADDGRGDEETPR